MATKDAPAPETLKRTMRETYSRASAVKGSPEFAWVTGELINKALGSTDYEPTAIYLVSRSGNEKVEQ